LNKIEHFSKVSPVTGGLGSFHLKNTLFEDRFVQGKSEKELPRASNFELSERSFLCDLERLSYIKFCLLAVVPLLDGPQISHNP
jgi:hypothetical protein